MSLIGIRDLEALPSVWSEARSTTTLHNERTNIPQIITRSEADAITYNSTGPVRRTTHETPQVSWREVNRPLTEKTLDADLNRQNYSPLAQNQSLYHSYDFLSFNYTIGGRGTYTPNLNPVVIDKII